MAFCGGSNTYEDEEKVEEELIGKELGLKTTTGHDATVLAVYNGSASLAMVKAGFDKYDKWKDTGSGSTSLSQSFEMCCFSAPAANLADKLEELQDDMQDHFETTIKETGKDGVKFSKDIKKISKRIGRLNKADAESGAQRKVYKDLIVVDGGLGGTKYISGIFVKAVKTDDKIHVWAGGLETRETCAKDTMFIVENHNSERKDQMGKWLQWKLMKRMAPEIRGTCETFKIKSSDLVNE